MDQVTDENWDVLNEDLGPTSLWTRVNIAEAFPGVPTPLTWSWAGPGSDIGVSRAWARMGVLPAARGKRQANVGDRMTAVHAGRAVLNLGVLREIGDSIPGNNGDKVEQSLFASEAVSEPNRPHRRRYPVVAVKLLPAALGARRELLARVPDTERWWSTSVASLSAAASDEPGSRTAEARALLAESFDRYQKLTTPQSINSMSVSGVYDRLTALCVRNGLADQAGALCTSDEPTPEAITVSDLWRVSRDQLSIEDFLRRHGYHAPVQGELAVASWRMDPTPVRRLVESYRRRGADEDPDTILTRLRRERDATEALLLSRVGRAARPAARLLVGTARRFLPLREYARLQFMQCYDVARAAAGVLGAHLYADGRLDAPEDVYYLTVDELLAGDPAEPGLVAKRKERREHYLTVDLPVRFRGRPEVIPISTPETGGRVLEGLSGSGGIYEGVARVISEPDDADDLSDGEILVCETTNPSWASYFLVAGAVVVDIGGPLSHGAIVAREMGIPCVINTRNARHRIKSGDTIRVDGTSGTVELLTAAVPAA